MEIINQKSPFEEHKLLNSLPRFLVEMNEKVEFYIAGGMVTSIFTNREINDIDVYLKNHNDLLYFIEKLLGEGKLISATTKSMMVIHHDKNGYEHKINLIYFDFFEKPEDVFECFDFTCVMGLYDVRNESFYFHKDFLTHNAQNRLMFNKNTRYPLMSMFRVKKYTDRGYTISKNEYLRMIMRCMLLEINSYDELEDQIGGMYGLDLDSVMDTSVPFDLDNVIDQISEVVSDFDETLYSRKWDEMYRNQTIDNILFYHRTIRDNSKLTKLVLDDVTILFKDGVLYDLAVYKHKILDEIPLHEDSLVKAYGITRLKDNGEVTIQTYESYTTKLLSDFLDENDNVINLYNEKHIVDDLRNRSNSLGALFEFDIKDIQNIKDISTFTPLDSDNKIRVKNCKYLDSLDINIPERLKPEAVDSDIIREKYDNRIYKLTYRNKSKLKKQQKNRKAAFSKTLVSDLPF